MSISMRIIHVIKAQAIIILECDINTTYASFGILSLFKLDTFATGLIWVDISRPRK